MTDQADLTARARIREAAVLEFGEHGYERATIRGIADRAGVSSGLLRHHFGSKQDLRDACDEFILQTIRKLNADVLADSTPGKVNYIGTIRSVIGPYQAYLARSLADGSAGLVFDEIVKLTEQWLVLLDQERSDPVPVDRRARATVLTAMSLSISVLHHHVSRGLGVPVFSEDGDLLLAKTLVDLYSHPLLSLEDAAAAQARLDEFRAGKRERETGTHDER
ncbi:TetR/AcrR family transcriptional regulator [Labedaea rhizosphaerae]|uniref:TetR family transcriptional regulator n=1 Tax=Labedaea rhizosphaerae TaxID=598644 RepID=A0A4R6S736_LABRH|nr:TetR/AcrR family transcriptional regulator [Labedaea rhizosphaerae]TDP95183.1 TetR family transcriptional regulator [Labedaea rhizosphaerae]